MNEFVSCPGPVTSRVQMTISSLLCILYRTTHVPKHLAVRPQQKQYNTHTYTHSSQSFLRLFTMEGIQRESKTKQKRGVCARIAGCLTLRLTGWAWPYGAMCSVSSTFSSDSSWLCASRARMCVRSRFHSPLYSPLSPTQNFHIASWRLPPVFPPQTQCSSRPEKPSSLLP